MFLITPLQDFLWLHIWLQKKLLFFVLLLLSSLAVVNAIEMDLNPMITYFGASPATTTASSTITFSAIDPDPSSSSTKGMKKLELYEAGSVIGSKNCNNLASCIYVKTISNGGEAGTRCFKGKAIDKTNNAVWSSQVCITFQATNQPPVISSTSPANTVMSSPAMALGS